MHFVIFESGCSSASWLVKRIICPDQTIPHHPHSLSRPGWRERMETGHICLSVCLSVFERRLPLNDVWQARQRQLWVLEDCFGVTEMWSVGSEWRVYQITSTLSPRWLLEVENLDFTVSIFGIWFTVPFKKAYDQCRSRGSFSPSISPLSSKQ